MLIKKFNLEKGKIYSIVGISKNSGKTTLLNHLLKEIYQTNLTAAITTIGIDGEKKDIVFKHPKPDITLYPDFYVATSSISFLSNPGVFKLVNNTNISTIYGEIYIAKTLKISKIELINTGNLTNIIKILAKLKNLADFVIVDGAFDRITSASPFICDGFIYSISTAQYNSISQFENHISSISKKLSILELKKGQINNKFSYSYNIYYLLKKILIKNPDFLSKTIFIFSTQDYKNRKFVSEKQLNSFFKNLMQKTNLSFNVFKDKFYVMFIVNTDSILNIGDNLKTNIQKFFKYNLIAIYTSGAITDTIIKTFFNINFKNNFFCFFIKDFTKFFLSSHLYRLILKSNIIISTLFSSQLKGITISSFSPSSTSLYLKNPLILKSIVKKYFPDIPVIDLFTDEL